MVAQVKKISSYQAEIIENDELRIAELRTINQLEQQCIELLGQANLTLSNFSKAGNLKYNQYTEKLEKIKDWKFYQDTLTKVLGKISELRHVLHLGTMSKEHSGALFIKYMEQSKEASTLLNIWHDDQLEKLQINPDDSVRKRMGWDNILYKPLSVFNEEKGYRPLEENVVQILAVLNHKPNADNYLKTTDLYQKDVRIIAKKGKYYYLPESV